MDCWGGDIKTGVVEGVRCVGGPECGREPRISGRKGGIWNCLGLYWEKGRWRLMTWTGCLGREVFGEEGELIAVAEGGFITFEPVGFLESLGYPASRAVGEVKLKLWGLD